MRRLQTARGTTITASQSGLRSIRLVLVAVAVGTYLIDQATKQWAVSSLDPAEPVSVLGDLLRFQLVFNPGAAFSMAEDFTVVLSIFALAALIFTVGWIAPRVKDMRWGVAVGLIMSGIAGNLTDRLFRPPGPFHGHVVDFFQLPYFAVFNVADMCLVFGVGFVVWLTIIKPVPMSGVGNSSKAVVEPKESS